jgi:hypothetical protein
MSYTEADQDPVEDEAIRKLRHDIKNQLSNINLALDQVRYEIPDITEDIELYLTMIAQSAAKIDNSLKALE